MPSGWPAPARTSELRVVDLAQPIHPGMARWRGARAEVKVGELDIKHSVDGGRLSGTQLTTPAHAGTHVDAARHFFPDGRSIDEYDVARFACRTIALDVRRGPGEQLYADDLRRLDPGIEPGDGVLLSFGWAEQYEQSSYYDHPYLSADAADYLVERRVNVLGVDTLTPDAPHGRRQERFDFPVHVRLLGADVLVIENLGPGLSTLLDRWFLLTFAPLQLQGGDASPIAPIGILSEPA